jgi:hypothetical protein
LLLQDSGTVRETARLAGRRLALGVKPVLLPLAAVTRQDCSKTRAIKPLGSARRRARVEPTGRRYIPGRSAPGRRTRTESEMHRRVRAIHQQRSGYLFRALSAASNVASSAAATAGARPRSSEDAMAK